MTTLERYNQVAEKHKITDELNVPPVARLGFAREQSNQMKMIVNRLVFDVTMTSARLEAAKDDDTKAALQQKVSEYEGQLRQTRDGLVVANELVSQLEEIVSEE